MSVVSCNDFVFEFNIPLICSFRFFSQYLEDFREPLRVSYWYAGALFRGIRDAFKHTLCVFMKYLMRLEVAAVS